MRLNTDTVNGNALGKEPADKVVHGGRLCACPVGVVVVDVQLCVWVGGTRGVECNADEALTKGVVEDGPSEAPVFFEDLVNDVPMEDAASPVGYQGGDVGLDDACEGCSVEATVTDPGGELRVPDCGSVRLGYLKNSRKAGPQTKSVAADSLSVGFCKSDDSVAVGQGEDPAGSLSGLPFHAVSGGDDTEFPGVLQDVGVGCVT